MPTPNEQKALAFFAIVILLGGAVRVVRAGSVPAALPQEQQALARQATAAESASAATPPRGRRRARITAAKPGGEPIVVGGVTTVPPYASYRNGFPPPSPRVDIGGAPGRVVDTPVRQGPIDLDLASVEEITRLPRVGPALARRIVARRDSFGPFGSMDALRKVKGVGPATAERLLPLVTFSGRPSSRP